MPNLAKTAGVPSRGAYNEKPQMIHQTWKLIQTRYGSLLALITLSFVLFGMSAASQSNSEMTRLAECRASALSAIKLEKVDIALMSQVADYCYAQVRGEDILSDFVIRRSKFSQQQVEGTIVLWLVVLLTFSGVALAAVQLVIGYRLASSGHGPTSEPNEITLERNKLSLKSSVAGLLILIISFAFFLVYVIWVFTINETSTALPESRMPSRSEQTMLSPGGLGKSPNAGSQASPSK
jgi:hypothetical protein